jgi:hypothetical protein
MLKAKKLLKMETQALRGGGVMESETRIALKFGEKLICDQTLLAPKIDLYPADPNFGMGDIPSTCHLIGDVTIHPQSEWDDVE